MILLESWSESNNYGVRLVQFGLMKETVPFEIINIIYSSDKQDIQTLPKAYEKIFSRMVRRLCVGNEKEISQNKKNNLHANHAL